MWSLIMGSVTSSEEEEESSGQSVSALPEPASEQGHAGGLKPTDGELVLSRFFSYSAGEVRIKLADKSSPFFQC